MSPDKTAVEFYSAHAEELARQYESATFAAVHGSLARRLPYRARVLDIGAGSGRDAAYLASKGFQVTAVEPSELIVQARQRHADTAVRWVRDALPDLVRLDNRMHFDAVLASAVCMHVSPAQIGRALSRIESLMKPKGLLALTLRLPAPDMPGSYQHDPDEFIARLEALGMRIVRNDRLCDALGREGVSWLTIEARALRSAKTLGRRRAAQTAVRFR